MREMVVDLRRLSRQTAEAPTGSAAPRPSQWWRWAAASVLLLIVAAGVLAFRNRSSIPAAPPRMEQITAFPDFATQPALSADGRMLAFIRGPNSFTTRGQIYVKLLPGGEPVQLTHDNTGKMIPVFSADGSRVAYTVATSVSSWDTWVVPVLGGEPKLWLPNASGLHWIGPQRLLFSEIKTGIHMALVAATESRTESRDVYVPESIRGMAHRSYLSPDGKQVLVTEMDNGGMGPCRVVPFDATSSGRIVGPGTGQCTHAAWSPDGRRMYFTSDASGSFQIWSQNFPDGKLEQLTFGPTQAEGLAMSPDGKSVITSIGLAQRSVWVADNGAERQASTEGNAHFPAFGDGLPTSVFSPDGKKLYYLVQAGVQRGFAGGELWVADLVAGSTERLLPGIPINSYDISSDGQRVVFSSFDSKGKARIWLARLDRRSSPTQLAPTEALGPVFGSDGEIYFRGYENNRGYLYELKLDSGQVHKIVPDEAVNSPTISPDGQWIVSWVPLSGSDVTAVVRAYPKRGGAPITICPSCFARWSRDQKFLFLSFNAGLEMGQTGRTFVIALEPGQALPRFPPAGVATESQVRKLPVVRVIDRSPVFPGATGSVYAFGRSVVQRNLYR